MQSEHKIQSRNGELLLSLTRVPKALGMIKNVWVPEAMVTSFKLETDESLLLGKAKSSIDMYNVDCVVANMLHSRKDTVYLVKQNPPEPVVERIDRPKEVSSIESILIERLIKLHDEYIQRNAPE